MCITSCFVLFRFLFVFCSGQPFPSDFSLGGSSQDYDGPGSGAKIILQSNSKYIQEIRQRLRENAVAREEREKRLDRFLVQQLKAHEAQEVKLSFHCM